nr:hypothetical protein CFP56_36344 [Quercus suber]
MYCQWRKRIVLTVARNTWINADSRQHPLVICVQRLGGIGRSLEPDQRTAWRRGKSSLVVLAVADPTDE